MSLTNEDKEFIRNLFNKGYGKNGEQSLNEILMELSGDIRALRVRVGQDTREIQTHLDDTVEPACHVPYERKLKNRRESGEFDAAFPEIHEYPN